MIGGLALIIVLWRALAFAGLLFRGQRLLGHDLRERRRDLEASAARLNQRVATLDAQAEAAARHAEATAKRAGGARRSERAPGPIFASGPEAPRHAARVFFVELGRLMSGAGAPESAAPQRIVFAFDNLDALPPPKPRSCSKRRTRCSARAASPRRPATRPRWRASTAPKRRGGGWRSCSRSSSTSRRLRLPTADASSPD